MSYSERKEGKRLAYPVIDLHCDLLNYLEEESDAHPAKTEDIGCAIPYLREGGVGLQVLAVCSVTRKGSADFAQKQVEAFNQLYKNHGDTFSAVLDTKQARASLHSNKTGIVVALENASGICEEDEPLETAFTRLEQILNQAKHVLYLSFTHNQENRFGGGNGSRAGLSDDGRVLLEYLHGRKIGVDLSHTSDALAHGILDHIDKKSLNVPVLVSHSNFRGVFHHLRNLPDEIAKEVIRRRGLIGMNFLRAFLHPDDHKMLAAHIRYGLDLGAKDALCFGADFFCSRNHPDKTRVPFFFSEHENAGKYQEIIRSLEDTLDQEERDALAYKNALGFIQRAWG